MIGSPRRGTAPSASTSTPERVAPAQRRGTATSTTSRRPRRGHDRAPAGSLRRRSAATISAGPTAVFICRAHPVRRGQDARPVVRAQGDRDGRDVLRPGMLVILQSTTYPGTTTEVVQARARGARACAPGVDFHLAFSPERVDPGNTHVDLRNTPKVVGGMTTTASTRAQAAPRVGDGRPEGLVKVRRQPGGGRDGEAAREHLPRGQHRARSTSWRAVPRDGHRRLGGHRRRGHEAVRLPGVLPRHRARRALHPRRPLLPVVEGAGVRLHHQVHRAGGRHELRHGRLRRGCADRTSS